MADDVRSLTAALARDPSSLAYAELAESLRRRGQRDEALRVALHGLARHPRHADGHDVLARIYAKSGDLDHALAYLRKAMEDGYKEIDSVYQDQEFAALRKDPRFAELMSSKPAVIPQ